LLGEHDLLEPLPELALDDLPADASGFFCTISSARSSERFASSAWAGIESIVGYSGRSATTCMARSRTSFWNCSLRATKSVSQLTSTIAPMRPPVWM